uniref:SJCHGC03136 protein n=1 Tax=Schistosoma japonicum TaxID=6182 RepID=Q5BSW1_SCHJA|nr:SJCHGC03136 protein [Schistosoma japonicum]
MIQSVYPDWNNRSSRSYRVRQVGRRAVRPKAVNIRSDDEVVLLAVLRCDASKVLCSDNQHNSDATSPQMESGVIKSRS